MGSHDDLVNQVGDPFRLVIEEGKIHELARATRSESAEHLRDVDPIAPVTMLAVSTHWARAGAALSDRLNLDVRRVLHGGQEYVWHVPPPCAGTVLSGQQRVDRVYAKEGGRGGSMRFIELVTEYTDERGGLVAEERVTLIETQARES